MLKETPKVYTKALGMFIKIFKNMCMTHKNKLHFLLSNTIWAANSISSLIILVHIFFSKITNLTWSRK